MALPPYRRPDTAEHPNDRVRDVVDLILLRSAVYRDSPDLTSLADACRKLFAARAKEAQRSGEVAPRPWPPDLIAHPHWQADYRTYAAEVGFDFPLEKAVATISDWISRIG